MRAAISIIIPAFNAASTLATAISSARQIESLEIIVVDDGSTDDTLVIAQQCSPPVTVLTGPNQGVSAARNRGLSIASGEWVIFLDADDILLPGTLEKRLSTAGSIEADVVLCDWEREAVSSDGVASIEVSEFAWDAYPNDSELRFLDHWAPIHAFMCKRELVLRVGGFRVGQTLIEDGRLWFDLAHAGARIVRSQHVGCRYTFAPTSASNRDKDELARHIYENVCYVDGVWTAEGAMGADRRKVLADRYYGAALRFYAASDSRYWEAIAKAQRYGARPTRHTLLAFPVARVIGISGTRRLAEFGKSLLVEFRGDQPKLPILDKSSN